MTDIVLTSALSRPEKAANASTKAAVTGASLVVAAVLAGVAIFLTVEGWPALGAASSDLPQDAPNVWALAGPLVFGSIWSALLAVIMALPLAVGVALFITWYAPRRIAGILAALVDVLAAVPSVVYGLWGLMTLAPLMSHVYAWLGDHVGWFPLFAGKPSATGRTIATGAMVLAIMIMPIIAAMCREVFQRTPLSTIEAAQGLGATRWEVIRLAVLPFARSGIVSGTILGLGRALGETMAIAMVVSPAPFLVSFSIITSENPNTAAAFIAQFFPEAHGVEVSALIALGLAIFIITFAVNGIARRITRDYGGVS